mmetsp:Transcript_7968/g.32905  ORF Transcript_7968/g.32905 Transcript_7968/m.32905 type:complete len:215 (-) Transcript_7968:477-1121(-)
MMTEDRRLRRWLPRPRSRRPTTVAASSSERAGRPKRRGRRASDCAASPRPRRPRRRPTRSRRRHTPTRPLEQNVCCCCGREATSGRQTRRDTRFPAARSKHRPTSRASASRESARTATGGTGCSRGAARPPRVRARARFQPRSTRARTASPRTRAATAESAARRTRARPSDSSFGARRSLSLGRLGTRTRTAAWRTRSSGCLCGARKAAEVAAV